VTLLVCFGAGAQSPAPAFSAGASEGIEGQSPAPPYSADAASGGSVKSPPSPYSIEASIGREYHSSPLLRIDPNGPLILIDGITNLSGTYGRLAASGLKDWGVGAETTLAVSAHAEWKRVPDAPDLDFGHVNIDAMIRHPFAGASLGVGPSAGRIWVARDRFRDWAGVRADVAKGLGDDGHWTVIADFAKQRHAEAYADLDARATSVMLQRHFADVSPAVKGVDFEAGYGNSRNANGFEDLSNRGLFARLGFELRAVGLEWSFGLMAQQVRYREPTFEGDPARRDRFYNLEVGVTKELNDGSSVQVVFTWGRNISNFDIYDNRYREMSVTYAFGR
jgi:hypothetical protein